MERAVPSAGATLHLLIGLPNLGRPHGNLVDDFGDALLLGPLDHQYRRDKRVAGDRQSDVHMGRAMPFVACDDLVQLPVRRQRARGRIHQQMRRGRMDALLPQLFEPSGRMRHVDGCLYDRERGPDDRQAVAKPSLGVVERFGRGQASRHWHAGPGSSRLVYRVCRSTCAAGGPGRKRGPGSCTPAASSRRTSSAQPSKERGRSTRETPRS